MRTITATTKKIIEASPFLQDMLASDLVNLSALARKIMPELQEQLWKTKISLPAVIIALKRLHQSHSGNLTKQIDLSGLGDMTVRSNLILLTYPNSAALISVQKALLDNVEKSKENFLNVSQGLFETTLIVSSGALEQVKHLLKKQRAEQTLKNLSSITVRIPRQSTFIPGYFYNILRPLALNKINIIDITSVNKEITLIFADDDIEVAFTVLKNLQKEARAKNTKINS